MKSTATCRCRIAAWRATRFTPSSPYSASKAGGELLVQAFVRSFRFPAVITRCSNNYGPWHWPEKMIPLFIMRLLEGKKVPVYGDGMQRRRLDSCGRPCRRASWRHC